MKVKTEVNPRQGIERKITPQIIRQLSSAEIEDLLSSVYDDFLYTVFCSAAMQAQLDDRKFGEAVQYAAGKIYADEFRLVRGYKGVCSFKGYLAAVCVDLVNDFASTLNGVNPARTDVLLDNSAMRLIVKANAGIFNTARSILENELSALPADDRIALRMHLDQKMGYNDIGMLLGMKDAEKRTMTVFAKLKRNIGKNVKGIKGLIP